MFRSLTSLALIACLSACTASSDDVGIAGEDDVANVPEGEATCPDTMVLALDDYPAETLPTTTDFSVWHEENAARDGVQSTETGLQYKVIQAGLENGLVPRPGEGITAHYHGYFPNGEVFDSSYERGQTMTHVSNGFISGWNQALAEMKVCEARTLYVPANLAYGENPVGRPGGTLVFHMQLLNVDRPDGDAAIGR